MTLGRRSRRQVLAAIGLLVLLRVHPRAAGVVVVMSSGGYNAALEQLAPAFEKQTGHHVRLVSGPSMGTSAEAIPNRLARGETADLVVMVSASLDALIAKGLVRAEGRADLATSKIGMAVQAGHPKPDLSTVDAFIKVLLAAKSIAYSDSASGMYIQDELYPRLGLAAALTPKSRMIVAERIGNVVARGDAEIGFQQVSELLPVPGIVFAGPIPGALQKITMFSAGIPASAPNPAWARELLAYLASPSSSAIVARTGLDPVSQK